MPHIDVLERPLHKPSENPLAYTSARTLEALVEAMLALEFLEKGYTRNAAGKMFQAWKSLTAALLTLNREKIMEKLEGRSGKKWVERIGIARVPSSKLKALSQLLEDAAGIEYYSLYIDKALALHDYQHHGPDPSGELSKYTSRGEAARDVVYMAKLLAKLVEALIKPRLEAEGLWSPEHGEALGKLKALIERS